MKGFKRSFAAIITLCSALLGCARSDGPELSLAAAEPVVLRNTVHALSVVLEQGHVFVAVHSFPGAATDFRELPDGFGAVYLDGTTISRSLTSGFQGSRPGPKGFVESFVASGDQSVPLYNQGSPLAAVALTFGSQSEERRLVWSAKYVAGVASAAETPAYSIAEIVQGKESLFGWFYTGAVRGDGPRWQVEVGFADGSLIPLTAPAVKVEACGDGTVFVWHVERTRRSPTTITVRDIGTGKLIWRGMGLHAEQEDSGHFKDNSKSVRHE